MPVLLYALFYGGIFLALGIYLPFWPVWLESRGLDAAEIGLVLALPAWIKVVSTPAIAQIADRSGRAKRVLTLCAASAIAGFAAFMLAGGFWSIVALTVLVSVPFMAMVPLADSLTLRAVYRLDLDYGRIRLWGSLTFLFATVGGGYVISHAGTEPVLGLILAALGATLVTTLFLPAPAAGGARATAGRHWRRLATRPFLLFLAAACLLQASHAVYYGFSALHWRANGLDETTIGLLWAEGVIAEIVLFALSRRLTLRWPPAAWLALAGLGGLLRWSVLAETAALHPLIAAQLLHALTFGAAHLGAMHFIARNAPAGLEASAQSLYAAVGGGLAMGLASLASGALYGQFAGGAFLAMAGLSACGLAAALALLRQSGQANRSAGTDESAAGGPEAGSAE